MGEEEEEESAMAARIRVPCASASQQRRSMRMKSVTPSRREKCVATRQTFTGGRVGVREEGKGRAEGLIGQAFPELAMNLGDTRPPKPEKLSKLPIGMARYEVMVVLRPDLDEEDWEEELAKFEACLDKEGVKELDSLVRGRQRMAYPIDGCIYGLFVLYSFIGSTQTGKAAQDFFCLPDLRPQKPILRTMIHRV